jgi:hypothetical protein
VLLLLLGLVLVVAAGSFWLPDWRWFLLTLLALRLSILRRFFAGFGVFAS